MSGQAGRCHAAGADGHGARPWVGAAVVHAALVESPLRSVLGGVVRAGVATQTSVSVNLRTIAAAGGPSRTPAAQLLDWPLAASQQA